jgi:hypothetical protein
VSLLRHREIQQLQHPVCSMDGLFLPGCCHLSRQQLDCLFCLLPASTLVDRSIPSFLPACLPSCGLCWLQGLLPRVRHSRVWHHPSTRRVPHNP